MRCFSETEDERVLAKLRQILLTQYIGSILIALILLQVAIEAVLRFVRIGFWLADHSRSASVLGESRRAPFPWDNLVFSGVTIALYLLVAYALTRWLFPSAARQVESGQEAVRIPDSDRQP